MVLDNGVSSAARAVPVDATVLWERQWYFAADLSEWHRDLELHSGIPQWITQTYFDFQLTVGQRRRGSGIFLSFWTAIGYSILLFGTPSCENMSSMVRCKRRRDLNTVLCADIPKSVGFWTTIPNEVPWFHFESSPYIPEFNRVHRNSRLLQ